MQQKQRIVHLFVYDTFSDWEPAYAIAALNNPSWQSRYCVRTVGVSREPIKTIGGLTIIPDMALAELTPAQSAMLILTGGEGWTEGKRDQALECARAFLETGVPVAAICGAVDGLACAGLLDDRRHTGNIIDALKATGYRGEALYQQERAFTDGDLITAGATASLEFAYHILKRLEVYTPEALEAWYGLFKTGDPAYHFALMRALGIGV
ncbi:type 1 glutamine amidotransferase family protein [Ktedonospora formicarum]|uniref:Putative protease YoaZ n=1 Tax=Ktedonospora formicarum TaxID=2778364 RepID=A0A8J3I0W1_9CHLR|nr:type 1 glutamine amidotransferase family protein [Ktedonospora formicarum]GHO46761.1 putative protease YoaZ [Ktedonospora formicarum]